MPKIDNHDIQLSLIMIVKNEENFLSRCLESVKDHVDEMVIVDTGSTDRTIEIAENYHAKVFRHAWQNDFAEHRNQSISYAKGRWLFMIDADEELEKGSGEVIRNAINHPEIDAIEVVNISLFNNKSSEAWNLQPRIFRNNNQIHYQGAIHEQLIGIKNRMRFPICLRHYGYDLDDDLNQKKYKRNRELLRDQISRDPENYFHHLNLAVTHSMYSSYQSAVDAGLMALKLAREQDIMNDNILWAFYIVASGYFKLNDLDHAEKYAIESLKLAPNHLDSLFILMLIYHHRKEWDRLINPASNLLEIYALYKKNPEKLPSCYINMINEEWRVHLALGDFHLNHNDQGAAFDKFRTALQMSPKKEEGHQITGDMYRYAGLWDEAKKHYENALLINNHSPYALFGLALTKKDTGDMEGYQNLMEQIPEDSMNSNADFLFEKGLVFLLNNTPGQSIPYFMKTIDLKPDHRAAHINLSLAYRRNRQLKKALEYNLRALELAPESMDAKINLGNLYYEIKEMGEAAKIYHHILESDPANIEIRLILCKIYLTSNAMEKCMRECNHILEILGICLDIELNTLTDLASIFLLISRFLEKLEKIPASKEALALSHELDPDVELKL